MPDDARATRLAGGVDLVDISHRLAHHPTKVFRKRRKPATLLAVHHTGVDNRRDGIEAWRATARHHVHNKDWPGIGYHFAINYRPVGSRNLVVFRCGDGGTVRAHTRGLNTRADGLVLQGHLGKNELSDYQVECLEAFLPWWLEQGEGIYDGYSVNGRKITWHSQALKHGGIPKLSCPGEHAVNWLRQYAPV